MSNIINYIFYVQTNVKLYHWMTKSYARHKASDEFVDKFLELTDKFVEVYIGKYGRPTMNKKDKSIQLLHLDDKGVVKMMDDLTTQFMAFVNDKDMDLLNLRDEIIALANHTKYLFTLD